MEVIQKKTVFLSGPMRGIERKIGMGWRLDAVSKLENKFRVLHAYRGREEKETFPDPRLAISRDKRDILISDVVIVNDSFENASMIGTAMEVLFAFENNKTIVVFGNGHEKDYWLNYHIHARVATLDEAIVLVNHMFST